MLELKTKIIFDPIDLTNKHKSQSKWKRVVTCQTDCDIHEYYAWFLNKRFNLKLNKPIRKAHITIVNDKIADYDLYKMAKELFHKKELVFKFDPAEIRTNGEHFWIKMYCDDVANIRMVMGLEPKPFFNLHLTIGYAAEGIRLEHAKYIHQTILRYNL